MYGQNYYGKLQKNWSTSLTHNHRLGFIHMGPAIWKGGWGLSSIRVTRKQRLVWWISSQSLSHCGAVSSQTLTSNTSFFSSISNLKTFKRGSTKPFVLFSSVTASIMLLERSYVWDLSYVKIYHVAGKIVWSSKTFSSPTSAIQCGLTSLMWSSKLVLLMQMHPGSSGVNVVDEQFS